MSETKYPAEVGQRFHSRKYGGNPRLLDGRTILVTGGTGSFGRRFVRSVLDGCEPRRLIVFSRDEQKHYDLSQDLAAHPRFGALRFFIGDVRDVGRLEMAFSGVDIVIHAAAMKHVPISEYNPFECIHTNVLGAENIVRAALRTGVKKVLALSTDKAANPINLYGASKLASDKIFVAGNNLSPVGHTRFSVVRYGNVVGSRGSVVPYFQRLLREQSDHLPITDPRMTRFWITLSQGVDFVLSCLDIMQGGEIFVPKIPSMRITDLAQALAPGLPHKIVGIRPGEKLHETMISVDDSRNTIELGDRFVIEPAFAFWNRKPYLAGGAHSVVEGFSYSSDSNSEWASREDLLAMLEG